MEEVKRYAVFVRHTFQDGVMDIVNLIQYGSSWPVKVYFLLIHLLLLSLVFYMFFYLKKNKYPKNLQRKGTRTFKRGNRVVTSESCQWLNSTITWCYQLHSGAKNTPEFVKMWIRNMNRFLYKKRTKNQRIFITNICPSCLPPKLTSVYCLTVDDITKCITFHVESTDLGFHVHVSQPTSNGRSKNVILEVSVLKLSGEVALQLNDSPFEVKISFIGEPEIQLSTRAITKDGIDAEAVEAVEEKLKEVICKTVTTVPLSDNTKAENETQNNGSLKDKLESPILQTCVGEEGKLLVKVIKATGLCSKDQSAKMSPYCILTADEPYQRKRTSLMKETDSPFWNEYFAFDITSKTREITLNIFDFENTPSDANYHMDDHELSAEKDDFLGQAIVPLATVNRNQTCRLILPILPKTNKCDYVRGELSLEFTFDKDGKVIDGALPLVDINDSSAKPTAVEHTVYDVTIDKTQAVPAVHDDLPERKTYSGAYAYSLDKSYMETSLDELAQEIEAYEAGTRSTSDEKPEEILLAAKPKEKQIEEREHDDTELMLEVAALDATLVEPYVRKKSPVQTQPEPTETTEDKEDNKPIEDDKEQEQEPETKEEAKEELQEEPKEEIKEELEEEKTEPKSKNKRSLFKRRPKSTVDADKKTDKDADSSRHSYHAGDQPQDEAAETKDDESKPAEEAELSREPKSKIRRSFNMKFKRGGKKDKEPSSSPSREIEAPKDEPHDEKKEQEAVEDSLKSDPPKSRFKSRFRRDKDRDLPSTTQETDTSKEEPQEEKKEQDTGEENVKVDAPKSRFSFRFKKDKDSTSTPQETDTPKEEPQEETKQEEAEESVKTDPPKSRFKSRFKRDKDKESKPTPQEGDAKEEDEKNEPENDQNLKSVPPKSRFSGRFKRSKDKKQNKDQDEKKDETKYGEKENEEKKEEEPKQEENREEVPKPVVVELIQEEPQREEPLQEEPKQEESIQEEPKHEEPIQEEPKQEESIQEEPKQEEPIQEEPKQEVPEKEVKQEEDKQEPKETKPERKELETVDENAEASTSEKPAPDPPKSRFRRLNLKRGNKRPVSMSAADIKPQEPIEEETNVDPVTHSYHAGDLPETSQLRKSTSQSSLLSYSPNPFSSLVIEVKDKGEKTYYHIPVSMAKRGTYEQKGVKYHVYNDHMFKAVHFDESTNCAVCAKSISGKIGKQGYQCKGCKMATHKKCHFQTSDMCSENAAKKVDIEDPPDHLSNDTSIENIPGMALL